MVRIFENTYNAIEISTYIRCMPKEHMKYYEKQRTPLTAPGRDVRDVVFGLALLADSAAEEEVLALLDTALSPGLTSALEIGVAAPAARGAGADCN